MGGGVKDGGGSERKELGKGVDGGGGNGETEMDGV